MTLIRRLIEKARGIIRRYGLDALLITRGPDISYFLNGYQDALALLIDEGHATALVPRLDYWKARERLSQEVEVVAYAKIERPPRGEGESLITARSIGEAILKLTNGRRIGIDDFKSPISEYLRGSGLTVIDVYDDVSQLRAVKEEEEVQLIERAIAIAEESLDKVLKEGLEGLSEREIAGRLIGEMIRRGADDIAFKPIVASGENAAYPHHEFSDRTIRKGELVVIDLGAKKRGYCSDITRTIGVGQVSKEFKDIAYAVLEAYRKALSTLRPGVKAYEIDEIAREVLREYRLDCYFIHGLGHGVGVEIHERPYLSPGNDEVIRPMQVVTIEPGVYIRGRTGVRIEDTVLVTETGAIPLSKYPLDLF